MSRIDRYKCDACGKEASCMPDGIQPPGWDSGWVSKTRFDACSIACVVRAARAAADLTEAAEGMKRRDEEEQKQRDQKQRDQKHPYSRKDPT